MLERINSWIAKGDNEQDNFNRYISYFVAFNMLYNIYAKQLNLSEDLTINDRKRAVNVANLIQNKSQFVIAINPKLLAYIKIIPVLAEEYWDRNMQEPVSGKLKEACANRNDAIIIEYLLKWLYKVRCNIFHGEKEYNPAKWDKLLSLSNELLKAILIMLLSDFNATYPHIQ